MRALPSEANGLRRTGFIHSRFVERQDPTSGRRGSNVPPPAKLPFQVEAVARNAPAGVVHGDEEVADTELVPESRVAEAIAFGIQNRDSRSFTDVWAGCYAGMTLGQYMRGGHADGGYEMALMTEFGYIARYAALRKKMMYKDTAPSEATGDEKASSLSDGNAAKKPDPAAASTHCATREE